VLRIVENVAYLRAVNGCWRPKCDVDEVCGGVGRWDIGGEVEEYSRS